MLHSACNFMLNTIFEAIIIGSKETQVEKNQQNSQVDLWLTHSFLSCNSRTHFYCECVRVNRQQFTRVYVSYLSFLYLFHSSFVFIHSLRHEAFAKINIKALSSAPFWACVSVLHFSFNLLIPHSECVVRSVFFIFCSFGSLHCNNNEKKKSLQRTFHI